MKTGKTASGLRNSALTTAEKLACLAVDAGNGVLARYAVHKGQLVSPIDAELGRSWLMSARVDGKAAVSRAWVDLVKHFASYKTDIPRDIIEYY